MAVLSQGFVPVNTPNKQCLGDASAYGVARSLLRALLWARGFLMSVDEVFNLFRVQQLCTLDDTNANNYSKQLIITITSFICTPTCKSPLKKSQLYLETCCGRIQTHKSNNVL